MKKKSIIFIKWLFSVLAPRWYIKRRFIAHHHYSPNFKKPKTYLEKLNKRKYEYTPHMSILSDKIAVRDYVKKVIGSEYLIPVHSVFDKLTLDIFNKLPDNFAIKANHGSGYNLIVRDKSKYSFQQMKSITDKWLNDKYYLTGMELHYRSIKPRLIVEKLLLNASNEVPKDFKLHIFRGNKGIKIFTEVQADRFSNFICSYYDEKWREVKSPFLGEASFFKKVHTQCPENFDELLLLGKKLSSNYPYLRTDFYVMGGKIYFGELTFTPAGGALPFEEKKIDEYLGALWGKVVEGEKSLI